MEVKYEIYRQRSKFFRLFFGFVWNYLEILDLDGHNLGTIGLNYGFDSFLMIL